MSNPILVALAERQIHPERSGKLTGSASSKLPGIQLDVFSFFTFPSSMTVESQMVEHHIGSASCEVIHRMLWVGSGTITKCLRLRHFQCFPQIDAAFD